MEHRREQTLATIEPASATVPDITYDREPRKMGKAIEIGKIFTKPEANRGGRRLG